MHLHINHMFCTRPCWGKEAYWCRYLVSIERNDGKDYHDEPEKDWLNLTEQFDYYDEERYRENRGFASLKNITDDVLKQMAIKKARRLKPEVLEWLNNNVKERKDEDYTQGWCCGNEDYLAFNSMSISIFFHRKAEALAFIKHWSVHKKPSSFFDYFKQ